MKIEKEAEKILDEFSKVLEDIPESDENEFMIDNLNLSREDVSVEKNPDKILRNASTDDENYIIAKKAEWVNK